VPIEEEEDFFINEMSIFRVYAKRLPLHVREVLPSIMKIFLNGSGTLYILRYNGRMLKLFV
jgi:hypothetical protein